jgi:hypothetical protein
MVIRVYATVLDLGSLEGSHGTALCRGFFILEVDNRNPPSWAAASCGRGKAHGTKTVPSLPVLHLFTTKTPRHQEQEFKATRKKMRHET